MGTNNSAILFKLSGVTIGLYQFVQNPDKFNEIPPLQSFNVMKTIEGNDIYCQKFQDNELRIMEWSRTSQSNYTNLKLFTTRDSNGVIPQVWFWDGTLGDMQETKVQVIDVVGEPLTAETGSAEDWRVKLTFTTL